MISFAVNQTSGRALPKRFWETWLRRIDNALKLSKQLHLSVGIVGETRMRNLNRMYRGQDRVTDILSFGDQEPDSDFLGELIICYPRARQQARQFGHSVEREFAVLLIHGILHLLGYKHDATPEADKMKRLEQRILGLK